MDVYTPWSCKALQALQPAVMKIKAGKSSSLGVNICGNIHTYCLSWKKKEIEVSSFVLQEITSDAHMQMLHICVS